MIRVEEAEALQTSSHSELRSWPAYEASACNTVHPSIHCALHVCKVWLQSGKAACAGHAVVMWCLSGSKPSRSIAA